MTSRRDRLPLGGRLGHDRLRHALVRLLPRQRAHGKRRVLASRVVVVIVVLVVVMGFAGMAGIMD